MTTKITTNFSPFFFIKSMLDFCSHSYYKHLAVFPRRAYLPYSTPTHVRYAPSRLSLLPFYVTAPISKKHRFLSSPYCIRGSMRLQPCASNRVAVRTQTQNYLQGTPESDRCDGDGLAAHSNHRLRSIIT